MFALSTSQKFHTASRRMSPLSRYSSKKTIYFGSKCRVKFVLPTGGMVAYFPIKTASRHRPPRPQHLHEPTALRPCRFAMTRPNCQRPRFAPTLPAKRAGDRVPGLSYHMYTILSRRRESGCLLLEQLFGPAPEAGSRTISLMDRVDMSRAPFFGQRWGGFVCLGGALLQLVCCFYFL